MKKNKLLSVLALSSIFATSVISASCEFGNGNGNVFSINTVSSRYEEKIEELEKILPSVIENHNFIEMLLQPLLFQQILLKMLSWL